ncbi:hypothetical protein [Psychroflexus montanilacus]|uniref:hypothetical protein n=1 Tax=Psychroflexus montanilacus TaxID=2873598 RepID=UPI001CC91C16|nr:hypothetical protein [Psychroflexus montanilacus]MBZ9651395.1 hypothetical protein [Psychroflexus montanilacus]
MKSILSKLYFPILLLLHPVYAISQQPKDKLIEAFETYSELPREISYAHLNKSKLIRGETLGFQVYVMNRETKRASTNTTNVYYALDDQNGNTVKSGLLLCERGVAVGSIDIDSTLATGNYLFKAYTNWMKNFKEQNFYIQNVKVINTDDGGTLGERKVEAYRLDAQFLPEGGHLIYGIENIVGVVVKDNTGRGVPDLEGRVYDEVGSEVGSFTTNRFGISKFLLIPKLGNAYQVKFGKGDNNTFSLGPAEMEGINLQLTDLGSRVALSLRTNQRTMERIKGNTYRLSFHNGDSIRAINFDFSAGQEVTMLFNYADLFSGMNVFTVFNEKQEPLLERLFFKHEGIGTVGLNAPKITRDKDSINVRFYTEAIRSIDSSLNISVSVLPEGTGSYEPNHSIVSKLYLQPYVRGFVERADYYFREVDARKRFELDMLLLTQGWSSFDWTSIFNSPPQMRFEFEKGITVTAKGTDPNARQYMVYPMENSGTVLVDAQQLNRVFTLKDLLPFEEEQLSVGVVAKNDKVRKPSLSYSFSPTSIPSLDNYITSYPIREDIKFGGNEDQPILLDAFNDTEVLNEVVITARKKEQRMEKLTRKFVMGIVDIFDNTERSKYINFDTYLSYKGYTVRKTGTRLIVGNSRPPYGEPIVYLDGHLLPNFDLFLSFDMRTVDYIVIDKLGRGDGIIRVFTDPLKQFEGMKSKPVAQTVDFPLTFRKNKRFYTPKYTSYKNDFFKKYGVIDWKPNLKVDEMGTIEFKILDTGNERLKFFVEGIAGDGKFISEEMNVIVNKKGN